MTARLFLTQRRGEHRGLQRIFSRLLPSAILCALCVSALNLRAAEPDKDDPAAELASFKLPPGFQANLFASEKDGVIKPIQIRWDTRGRLWVIGSQTYPQLVPGEEPNDKVLILEDTNGDGVCDKTTVFADGLMIPTGLEIAPTPAATARDFNAESAKGAETRRGKENENPSANLSNSSAPSALNPSACYLGEGTKLLLLTDTDGDEKCDKREVVLRGFGTGDNHQNINSFRWSPGGELFFSQGLHAHARIETPYGIVPLDEAGFWRYRPREGRLDSFYGGPAEPQNPWGFVWTDWGQMLMCAGNNGGIYWPLPEMIRGYRYGKRDQIWENARGRKSSGPDIIGTAHLPPEWQGVMLTGGYINNAVWALKIEDDGAGFRISDFKFQISDLEAAPADEATRNQKPETRNPPAGYFVQSTHPSFRPVDVKVGPDGAIYLCDWYNPIIGHYQASFRHPDRDKTHGRIWRITYKDRPLVKPPKIAGAPLAELFENLKSGERWVREMTRLELMGRKTEEVVPVLREWWPKVSGRVGVPPAGPGILPGRTSEGAKEDPKTSDAQKVRAGETPAPAGGTPTLPENSERTLVEVLGVFEAQDTPEPALLARVIASSNPNVRVHGAEAVGWRIGKATPFELPAIARFDGTPLPTDPIEALAWLSADENPRVRLAAWVAAANQSGPKTAEILISHSGWKTDKFIELAIRSGASTPEMKQHLLALDMSPEKIDRMLASFRLWQEAVKAPLTGAPAAAKISATVPATGKLRATPEFVAGLVHEVRDSGNAKHGGEVFRRAELACTACHSIADQGGKIGPPLDAIGSGQPLDFIIGATLEPQREIKESYEALQLTAKDGRTALGYIAARNPQQTTVRDPATGAETKFANVDIAEQKQLGSFMPAGLVDNLSWEDLRDLFAYLAQLGKPR
jgi:putative heme-binding domain-containing protein